MYEQKINALNIKNSKANKIIEEQKIAINQLNKENMNYKRMEKNMRNQIINILKNRRNE